MRSYMYIYSLQAYFFPWKKSNAVCTITSISKLDFKVFSQYISWLKVMYLSRNSKKMLKCEVRAIIEYRKYSTVDADPVLHRVPAVVL